MARILITHATRAGATRDVADILAGAFREQGHDVWCSPVRDAPSLDGVDLVVAGSGIHVGAWYGDAVDWLSRNADAVRGRVALFNVCLNAADPAKQDEALGYNASLAEQLEAVSSASFAGRYVPERVGVFKRLFLRSLKQEPRDLVDPPSIRRWAEALTA